MNKEKELIMIRSPQLDEWNAEKIVDFAKRVRDLYKSDELTTAVSTRMCLAVAELVVDGMPLIRYGLRVKPIKWFSALCLSVFKES